MADLLPNITLTPEEVALLESALNDAIGMQENCADDGEPELVELGMKQARAYRDLLFKFFGDDRLAYEKAESSIQ